MVRFLTLLSDAADLSVSTQLICKVHPVVGWLLPATGISYGARFCIMIDERTRYCRLNYFFLNAALPDVCSS